MKKKKRSIPVYASNSGVISATLIVNVDDNNEEWLTPEQVIALENAHKWARYAFNQPLKAYRRTFRYCNPPTVTTYGVFDSTAGDQFIKRTPAYDGAGVLIK